MWAPETRVKVEDGGASCLERMEMDSDKLYVSLASGLSFEIWMASPFGFFELMEKKCDSQLYSVTI